MKKMGKEVVKLEGAIITRKRVRLELSLSNDCNNIVLDFADVEFISTPAIDEILHFIEDKKSKGCDYKIVNADENIQKLINRVSNRRRERSKNKPLKKYDLIKFDNKNDLFDYMKNNYRSFENCS